LASFIFDEAEFANIGRKLKVMSVIIVVLAVTVKSRQELAMSNFIICSRQPRKGAARRDFGGTDLFPTVRRFVARTLA